MKKTLTLMLALLMIFGSIMPNALSANSEEYISSELIDEMKFYFKEAGTFDDNGNYIVKDINAIVKKAESGDTMARELAEIYYFKQQRSVSDFAKCILKDYFGVYIDLINGDLWDAFVDHIKDEAWTAAAKIILKILGKSVSKANIVATVGQIAVAAYNCRGEW